MRVAWGAWALLLACTGGGSTPDASSDAIGDVGTEDALVVYPEASPPCEPAPVDASAVTWTPPHAPEPGACSDAQIAAYYTACLPGSQGTCATWTAANATCYACLHSTIGKDTSLGPVVDDGAGIAFVNLGGCIALETGDTSATGCGALAWDTIECEDLACRAACDVSSGDPTAYAQYESCMGAAQGGTCSALDKAQCGLADANVSACDLGATSVEEVYAAVAGVMCGGGE